MDVEPGGRDSNPLKIGGRAQGDPGGTEYPAAPATLREWFNGPIDALGICTALLIVDLGVLLGLVVGQLT